MISGGETLSRKQDRRRSSRHLSHRIGAMHEYDSETWSNAGDHFYRLRCVACKRAGHGQRKRARHQQHFEREQRSSNCADGSALGQSTRGPDRASRRSHSQSDHVAAEGKTICRRREGVATSVDAVRTPCRQRAIAATVFTARRAGSSIGVTVAVRLRNRSSERRHQPVRTDFPVSPRSDGKPSIS